jgi:hypothetical protein
MHWLRAYGANIVQLGGCAIIHLSLPTPATEVPSEGLPDVSS